MLESVTGNVDVKNIDIVQRFKIVILLKYMYLYSTLISSSIQCADLLLDLLFFQYL